MTRSARNVGASVRARLLNLAQATSQPFERLLIRFVHERLLYRLTQTRHRSRFALKGALLLTTWFKDPHRPTRDLDLMGFGDPDPSGVLEIFRETCVFPVEDGVRFTDDALRIDRIRDELEYGGLRLRHIATVDGARVHVVIDIGFGDSIVPGLEEIQLPVLLDFPAPRLRAYARETVVAEKFHAIVTLGHANSRLKDFYDLWVLSRTHDFDRERLGAAMAATFGRRGTALPKTVPDGLTPEFATDPAKRQQWSAFIRDVAIQPGSLQTVVDDLVAFLVPGAKPARAHKVTATSAARPHDSESA